MKTTFITSFIVGAVALAGVTAAYAQGAPQTVVSYSVDVARVANGYRASKIIGATVYNDTKEEIGKIDDLIVNRDDRVPYATVSVGGFLGIGDKLVVVPFGSLQLTPERIVMPGATKAALKDLPKFTYATK
jgi:sporulation protein YlmC with PRC-barrel domain